MAKRIYSESIKSWGKKVGIPAGGVGTMIGLIFLFLSLSGAITITGFSGDQVCAGTIEDPCYAYINFTAEEDIFIYPLGYDPWGRETPFEFSPAVSDWRLQRTWGNGWKNIPLDKTCTGTWCGAPDNKGVAYSYVLRKNHDYEFRIVAYKHNPSDTIKWAVNYEDKEYLDPTWLPILNYTIDGDKVYVNDSKVYIEVYPHTASNNEWVTFNFTSKVYSGYVDIILGFNMSEMRPQGVRKYNPTNETRQRTYVCDYEFNYTMSPKYATCFKNIQIINNETSEVEISIEVLFEREFDTGDILAKTVYWTEEYVDEYKEVSSDVFDSVDYNYNGIDKWYYYKNLEIQQGEANAYQVKIKSINPWGTNSKYWFGIKPSHLTMQEAIEQDKFYAIDPWTGSLLNDVAAVYSFNEASGDLLDIFGSNDGNVTGADYSQPGVPNLDDSYGFVHLNNDMVEATSSVTGDTTVSAMGWLKVPTEFATKHQKVLTINSNGAADKGFSVAIRSATGSIAILIGGVGWGTLGPDITDNAWHSYMITRNGNNYNLYLDGGSSAVSTFTNAGGTFGSVIVMGSNNEDDHSLGGFMDETAFFSSVKSTADFATFHNSGNGLPFGPDSNFPIITESAEKPDDVFTNTDWIINVTVTNSNDTYMNVYTRFFVNGSEVGDLQIFNITNNTNSLVATLVSGNFSAEDNLTAKVWAENTIGNSSNSTLLATVQFISMSGTLKDGDGNNLNATVFIVNQTDDSLVGNTTSLNGVWTFGPMFPGTYVVTGYDPSNSTLDGDAEPHVVIPA